MRVLVERKIGVLLSKFVQHSRGLSQIKNAGKVLRAPDNHTTNQGTMLEKTFIKRGKQKCKTHHLRSLSHSVLCNGVFPSQISPMSCAGKEKHFSKPTIVPDAEFWSKSTDKCRHSGSMYALCKSSLKICHMADCRRVL